MLWTAKGRGAFWSDCGRCRRAESSGCSCPAACAPEHLARCVCRFDMTTAHWKRVSVSAFLRYEYYHPSIFRGIPGVVQRQGVRTPDAEEAILDSIVDLYYDRVPPEVRCLCV